LAPEIIIDENKKKKEKKPRSESNDFKLKRKGDVV
jgi:hypothetical protein